jgi:hypothetical protein
MAPIDLNVEHTLASVQALDPEGRQVRLGTLWEDCPAVLVFLREFG